MTEWRVSCVQREREAPCRTSASLAAEIRHTTEQRAPAVRTVVACNSTAMPRQPEEGLPEAAGLEDDWHQLVTWKSRSARAAHWAKLVVCNFVEAWLATPQGPSRRDLISSHFLTDRQWHWAQAATRRTVDDTKPVTRVGQGVSRKPRSTTHTQH